MDDKWNVYAWHKNGPAIRVCEEVSIYEASFAVDAYRNKGLDWDAYMVQTWDDPGWSSNNKQ